MVFGSSIISSPRGNLSLQKTLDLANLFLENADKSTDPEIILALCHETEISLSQAKKIAKKTNVEFMNGSIAAIYYGLSDMLDKHGHRDEAAAFRKKIEKWGDVLLAASEASVNLLSNSLNQHIQESAAATIPCDIFPNNVHLPTIEFKPPEPDARLIDTPQLACCLGLLQADTEPDDILDIAARKWLKDTKKDPDEGERLVALATDVIRAFKRDELKDAKAVTEVVCLAPVVCNDDFRYLVKEFYSGIDQSGLLDVHQLKGLAHLVKGAPIGSLDADDLVRILELLSTRLQGTHQQSTDHFYQLIMALSHVLDAMADTEVKEVDREKIHEPLSSYLDDLKK
ncbi:hypothetical protein BGX34_003771, partial [Mortierella sp. NVP85]